MRIVIRLVLLAVVVALGAWLWTVLFPSPEKLILRKVAGLATTASVSPGDGNLARANKVGNLIGDFSVDAEIIFDVPELGTRTLTGRDEIRDTLRGVLITLTTLKVELLDATVRVGAHRQTAEVSCTLRVSAGDKKDFGVQELRFQFKKMDGAWLITRVQTVKTLS